jgi:hypothetical protein
MKIVLVFQWFREIDLCYGENRPLLWGKSTFVMGKIDLQKPWSGYRGYYDQEKFSILIQLQHILERPLFAYK